VKFLEFAFRLGVIFAIFGFIWGFFQMVLSLFRAGRPKTIVEEYVLKFAKYFFLVDVTFLFCIERESANVLMLNQLILTALILVLYFIGKLQNQQNRLNLVQFAGARFPGSTDLFSLPAEIAAIVFSMGLFGFFIYFPAYANNPISNWFYKSILDIEETFFFGTIFQIIGFFVLMGILLKLVNGIVFLITGNPLMSIKSQFNDGSSSKDKDSFDDFEELND
jgi:hypothetical protein